MRTDKRLKKSEVEQIYRRCMDASPETWELCRNDGSSQLSKNILRIGVRSSTEYEVELSYISVGDQEFIASCRQDIPRLLSIIEKIKTNPKEYKLSIPIYDEIEERCNNASLGEWKSYIEGRDMECGSNFIMTGVGGERGDDIEVQFHLDNDQDFVAHARQDIPRLITEIKILGKIK